MKQILIKQENHLLNIRDNKTTDIPIKAFGELLQAKETPTRYKLHKQTKIAYSTINKYYEGVIDG
jgi:hypothetical protein